MKFIVAHTGARRGYAVPSILERAGFLERFYTDVCADVGLGKVLLAGRGLPLFGKKLGRLSSRRLPPEIRNKTSTFGAAVLKGNFLKMCAFNDPAEQFRAQLDFNEDLGRAMVKAGFGTATHVFSMLGEGGPFWIEAKRRGLLVVSEVYIRLSAERIVEREREQFPGWENSAPNFSAIRQERSATDVLLDCTDLFICPSKVVQDDLALHWGIPHERTVFVPYGMSPDWLMLHPTPLRGRVLFVGTAELRKGIHYLASAAKAMTERGRPYSFRVVGDVAPQIASRVECNKLTFLGRLSRERLREEYQTADVFVLPSLAEGSAEAIFEALAVGLPVITTASAGSVVRDGIEGHVIPERNPRALASAIERVVEDRMVRDRMSAEARERARDYTWEKYGKRLLAALKA